MPRFIWKPKISILKLSLKFTQYQSQPYLPDDDVLTELENLNEFNLALCIKMSIIIAVSCCNLTSTNGLHYTIDHYSDITMSAMVSQSHRRLDCLLNRHIKESIKAPRHRRLWWESTFPEFVHLPGVYRPYIKCMHVLSNASLVCNVSNITHRCTVATHSPPIQLAGY